MKKICLALSFLLFSSSLYANESDEWQQDLTLYGWLPTLDGTLKFKVPSAPYESTDANAIDSLETVFMGSYEARKNHWSFLADLIYLKMSGDAQGINTSVDWNLDLSTKLYSFYAGYNVSDTNDMRVDVIGGVRYFSLELDASRSSELIGNETFSNSVENYDAVIGIKGEYNVNAQWYVPYQFDIGGGDSDLTWQASVSLGYRFGWGDIIATYRYMHYDKGDSLLINDFNLYGPKLGVVFHF